MSQLSPEIGEEQDRGPAPDTIYEDETLRVSGIRGGDKALFIAFTGIGHRLGAMQREEFVRVAQGGGEHSVLFVQDKTRSWYNEPGFAEKLQPIVAEWGARCEKIVTIGNSMGGFGAIVFAGLLDADIAIAFSPQYSVSSSVIPQENRWSEFTSQIKSFTYEGAGDYIVSGCEYYLFQGDGGKDWHHVALFPLLPNVRQFVIRSGPHNLASILKARGFLSRIVAACTAGDLGALNELMVTYNGAVLRSPDDDPWAGKRPRRGGERLDPTANLPALPAPSRQLHTAEERRELRRTHKRVGKQQKRWTDKQTERLDRREAARAELIVEARAAIAAAEEAAPRPADEISPPSAEAPMAESVASTVDRIEAAVPEELAAPGAISGPQAPKPGLETLLEDETLHVSGIRGGHGVLFIAFTEIGDRVGPLRRDEFIELARGTTENAVLFVSDRQRTWYNAPDFLAKLAPIVAVWRPESDRTVTIGNSMGGFGAIVFAGALGADTAIAFSPQYSVSRDVVPKEDRWSEFTSKIGEFRYESAGDYIVDGCTYFLFQGDGGKDWYQIGGFPIRPNLHQFIVRDGPHTLASLLKLRGDLGPIIHASVAGDLNGLNELMFAQGNARLRSEDNDPYKAPIRPRRDTPRADMAQPRHPAEEPGQRSLDQGAATELAGIAPVPAAERRGAEARRAARPPRKTGLLDRLHRFFRKLTGRPAGAGKKKGRPSRP